MIFFGFYSIAKPSCRKGLHSNSYCHSRDSAEAAKSKYALPSRGLFGCLNPTPPTFNLSASINSKPQTLLKNWKEPAAPPKPQTLGLRRGLQSGVFRIPSELETFHQMQLGSSLCKRPPKEKDGADLEAKPEVQSACVCVCAYIRYIYIYIYISVCVYVCICSDTEIERERESAIYIYIATYIYICIQTHIHRYMLCVVCFGPPSAPQWYPPPKKKYKGLEPSAHGLGFRILWMYGFTASGFGDGFGLRFSVSMWP